MPVYCTCWSSPLRWVCGDNTLPDLLHPPPGQRWVCGDNTLPDLLHPPPDQRWVCGDNTLPDLLHLPPGQRWVCGDNTLLDLLHPPPGQRWVCGDNTLPDLLHPPPGQRWVCGDNTLPDLLHPPPGQRWVCRFIAPAGRPLHGEYVQLLHFLISSIVIMRSSCTSWSLLPPLPTPPIQPKVSMPIYCTCWSSPPRWVYPATALPDLRHSDHAELLYLLVFPLKVSMPIYCSYWSSLPRWVYRVIVPADLTPPPTPSPPSPMGVCRIIACKYKVH